MTLKSMFVILAVQFAGWPIEAGPKEGRVVVYIWSPNMVLSQKGLVEALGRKWPPGTKLLVRRDPNSNEALAKTIAKRHGWTSDVLKIADDPATQIKGARVHFPSYLFLKGEQRSPLVLGYKTPAQIDRLVEKYL